MLRDVDEYSLDKIDEYEGNLYRRTKITLKLNHEETDAYAYVPKDAVSR